MTPTIDEILSIIAETVRDYQVPVVDLIAVQSNDDPYRILTATILSARTKDETTAKAARRLFQRAPNLAALAALTEAEIAELIYPVGFYRNKAAYLHRLPAVIAEKFGGRIPDGLEDLQQLPGVGRKTANLVRGVAFGKPAICVDTHVHRIMNIWGYVATTTPLATEMALRQKLPAKHWRQVNTLLVAFGQAICRPVRPRCEQCPLAADCPRIGVRPRRAPAKRNTDNNLLKMVSWNVNGLRAVARKGFTELLAELDADLLALQEIKAQPEQLDAELLKPPGYHAFWNPAIRKGYSGTCIYSRQEPLRVLYGLGIPEHDQEGRVITLEFADFYLINAYFPNARHDLTRLDYKLAFNRDLHAFAARLADGKSVVVCGDFNVAHQELDLANPAANRNNPGFTDAERAWMDTFVAAGFVDTFRMFTNEGGHYSWWSYRFNARAKNIGWRIDYFCVDAASARQVSRAAILQDIQGSDHCPVTLEFRPAAR